MRRSAVSAVGVGAVSCQRDTLALATRDFQKRPTRPGPRRRVSLSRWATMASARARRLERGGAKWPGGRQGCLEFRSYPHLCHRATGHVQIKSPSAKRTVSRARECGWQYQPEGFYCGHFRPQCCSARGCFPLAQNTRQYKASKQYGRELLSGSRATVGLSQT